MMQYSHMNPWALGLIGATLSWTACADTGSEACVRRSDCAANQTCTLGACEAAPDASLADAGRADVSAILDGRADAADASDRGVDMSTDEGTGADAGAVVCVPPEGLFRQDPQTFEEINRGFPFTDRRARSIRYGLRLGHYSAFRIEAPMNLSGGRVFFENGSPADGGVAGYTVSLSRCVGDFVEHLGQDTCRRTLAAGALRWSTDPDALAACIFEPGETYFLNIVHSVDEGSSFTTTSCPDQLGAGRCGVLFQHLAL